jgi:predicted Rdx family selenoprotein
VAVSVAAELSSISYRETSVTLTPAGKGTFEVYVNGKKMYDRKEPGAVDFLPALKEIHKIRDTVRDLFAAEPATAGAH